MFFFLRLISVLLQFQTVPLSALPAPPAPPNNGSHEAPTRQGWTDQPDQRGSLDILWSSLFTMFLSSWAILCLNVPPQGEKEVYRWRRKFWMTCLTLLAPEWVFQMAVGQWLHARRSVKEFQGAKMGWWTLKHAFYANMGGFMLRARDTAAGDDATEPRYWKPFPLTANQLFYLIERGYFEPPRINKRMIRERDKVDGAIRLLTVLQIIWFLINLAGRAAQHLPVTCLELTTATFIFAAIGITFCWTHKPADLVIPTIITTEYSIQEILLQAGDRARQPYLRTPLDFVDYEEWSLSLYFQHCVRILNHMRVPVGRPTAPRPSIENTFHLPLSDNATDIILILSLGYTALFFPAWNFTYPTQIERSLFRAAIITILVTLPCFWLTTRWAFSWLPWLRDRYNLNILISGSEPPSPGEEPQWPGREHGANRCDPSLIASCRNNSVSKHEKLALPLKAVLPMYVLGVFYCTARAYIYVADFVELRSLEPKCYDNVDWASLLPHI